MPPNWSVGDAESKGDDSKATALLQRESNNAIVNLEVKSVQVYCV